MDNDMYGHVNNVNYYSYFDTAINEFLIKKANFNPLNSEQIGFIVKSSCEFIHPISYPGSLIVGVAIKRVGNSSVDYVAAIFDANETLCATGELTHVFVERISQKPQAIDEELREVILNYQG
ncbi:acyl-CoA thioesterase [Glaciecola sp. MH2013]|nr:acyl-CoA thioesterase [Glaciecola sp. MH2013]